MEMLRRAAAAPLLIAEPDSFWPDLAATRLLERERPVAYIYAELLEKRRFVLDGSQELWRRGRNWQT